MIAFIPGNTAIYPAEPESPSPQDMDMSRILLAEDNPGIAKVTTLMLISWGHSVATASNGEEALALPEARGFDAAILDVRMPVMDGITAAKHLSPQMPIIGFTAVPDPHTRERLAAAGVTSIVVKPFDPSTLEEALKDVL